MLSAFRKKSMPHDITTSILRNIDLGNGNFLVEFEAAEMVAGMQPAQFFMIGIPGSETLLRRPFSACGTPGTFKDGADGAAQVLYKVVGKGTALMASLKAGATLNVLGPLGRGFTPPPGEAMRPLLVAGGIGAAPFPALVASLRSHPVRPAMLYGAATAGDLPLLNWFREETEEVTITTDDGSLGREGLVTDPLAELLDEGDPNAFKIYACGPEPMLKAVSYIAMKYGVDCELSLEAHMACGFGACLGCVVPTRGESGEEVAYDRVCMEGPVMRPEVLAW
jgi:dihydroorotate dehydrogenase electron transfer subunit